MNNAISCSDRTRKTGLPSSGFVAAYKATSAEQRKARLRKLKAAVEARGVCLVLGPWNFPPGLVLGPLAAAVAAGNSYIVKLTDLCPATAAVAAKIIREAFDERKVARFEGDVDVATALLELPFSSIFFTGSTHGGTFDPLPVARPGSLHLNERRLSP